MTITRSFLPQIAIWIVFLRAEYSLLQMTTNFDTEIQDVRPFRFRKGCDTSGSSLDVDPPLQRVLKG